MQVDCSKIIINVWANIFSDFAIRILMTVLRKAGYEKIIRIMKTNRVEQFGLEKK